MPKNSEKLTIAYIFNRSINILGEFFIIPLSYETSLLAFQQYGMNQITPDFLTIKHKEDVLGGVNLLILFIYCATRTSN